MIFFSGAEAPVLDVNAVELARLEETYAADIDAIHQLCLSKTIQTFLALKGQYAANRTMDWMLESIVLDIQFFNATRKYQLLDRSAVYQSTIIHSEKKRFDAIRKEASDMASDVTTQFINDYKRAYHVGHTVEHLSWFVVVSLGMVLTLESKPSIMFIFSFLITLQLAASCSTHRENQGRLHAEALVPRGVILDEERLMAQLEGRMAVVNIVAPVAIIPTTDAGTDTMPLIMAMNV